MLQLLVGSIIRQVFDSPISSERGKGSAALLVINIQLIKQQRATSCKKYETEVYQGIIGAMNYNNRGSHLQ